MSTDLLERPSALYSDPQPHRWTGEEVYRLLELGFFEGQRIELIEGEIVEMAAQSNLHAISIEKSRETLAAVFGVLFWIRVQMSLDLSPLSIIDPDIAVVDGAVRSHLGKPNPTTARLIVEVSETTLRYDRKTKGSLYAKAQIADYWIVNLEKRLLEVYRDPQPDEKAKGRHRNGEDYTRQPQRSHPSA